VRNTDLIARFAEGLLAVAASSAIVLVLQLAMAAAYRDAAACFEA
jgi:hypothetical protein